MLKCEWTSRILTEYKFRRKIRYCEQSDNISITNPPTCSHLIFPMLFSMSYTDKYSWIIKLAVTLESCCEPFENVS